MPDVIARIAKLTHDEIRPMQICLAQQGCYKENEKQMDGVVGQFTQAALYRYAFGQCSVSIPQTPPACGTDMDITAWKLTKSDVKKLVGGGDSGGESAGTASAQNKATDGSAQSTTDDTTSDEDDSAAKKSGSADVQCASTSSGTGANAATQNSQELKTSDSPAEATNPACDAMDAMDAAWKYAFSKGAQFVQGLEYSSENLFDNALEFFSDQYVKGDASAHQSFRDALRKREKEIAACACKAYPMEQQATGWKSDAWHAKMLYSLSDQVYAFYPNGSLQPAPLSAESSTASQPAPAQPRVDFGVLDSVGWTGATFTQTPDIMLHPILRSPNGGITQQIELARRFRTSVDLVVYKSQSEDSWRSFASNNRSVSSLSQQIVDEVTRRQGGFLNGIQYWVFPDGLTMPTTAWDGVTLDFRNFPYDDTKSVAALVSMIKDIRTRLEKVSRKKTAWQATREHFAVNLVVPYSVFAPDGECSLSASVSATVQARIMQLAQLVPRDLPDDGAKNNSDGNSILDHFIVMLPQPTSCTKKALHHAIESAFERTPEILELMKTDKSLTLAGWRYQLLRHIMYVLLPGTWKYQGPDYATAGSQMYDDLIYAKGDFGGVAFASIPVYRTPDPAEAKQSKGIAALTNSAPEQAEGTELALDIHKVFHMHGTPDFGDPARGQAAAKAQSTLVIFFENSCGALRRELALSVEALFALLLLYAILSYWLMELRDFFNTHRWLFGGVVALAVSIILLLCSFDRSLRDEAIYIYGILTLLALIAVWIRIYIRSARDRNLP